MQPRSGPPSFENWKGYIAKLPSQGAYEYPLVSDAHFTGTVTSGFGPYELLNAIPLVPDGTPHAGVILRMEFHLPEEDVDDPAYMAKKEIETYHGGTVVDEVAALVSLILGVRLKAGPMTRSFDGISDDLRGMPRAIEGQAMPILLKNGLNRGEVLPNFTTAHSLNDVEVWSSFPELQPEAAAVLIRSARLYQDAVWIAESEVNLSWLMLVSGVETAANHWRKDAGTPIERLRASEPKLAEYLEGLAVDGLIDKVVPKIVDEHGMTKKFIDFLIEFLPDPPSARPEAWGRMEWTEKNLREAFRLIYKYRSKALHDGTPFPLPMCEPPTKLSAVHFEVPMGLATKALEGYWDKKETPMLFHVFEYIARHALLKWWKSLEIKA